MTFPHPLRRKTDRCSVFLIAVLSACTPLRGGADTPGATHALTPMGDRAPIDDGPMPKATFGEVDATARVCTSGPQVALLRGRHLMAEARIAQADVLPNPTLSGQHNQSFTGEEDFETVVGIQIPLGIGGRRWLLQDAAALRSAQIALEATQSRVTTAVAFRRTFVRASLAHARFDLLEAQQKSLASLVVTIGKLQAGGENAQLDRDRLALQGELSAAAAAGHDREATALVAWLEVVAHVRVELTRDLSTLAGGAASLERDGGESPRIAALQKSAEASEVEAEAADRQWIPDVRVFGGYRAVGGKNIDTGHGMSLGLSLPVTFFDHGQAQARQAEAAASIAAAKLAVTRRNLEANEQSTRRRLARIAAVSPRVSQALALATRAEAGVRRLYLAGEAELVDVLSATQTRLSLGLAFIDMAEERADALLTLAATRGRFSEPKLASACGGDR